ncbi:MAG TPA: carboxylating nicotinate-nucleotide diphosphorylase, partial [Gammaproteobacteria bacterium]|nr:carboxylating nicotinate-nucleotide diphosphorylase [Gammaproteobacteria bacterium]
ARVIVRETAVLCGTAWFDEVFRQLDRRVQIIWQARDGERLRPGQTLCQLRGPARSLLSGERAALNFLQTLSATATHTRRYADAIAGTGARLLDTRKTLPGLRTAQKYATVCGGAQNHRMGLFDAFLIKENHILAAGGIAPAVARARQIAPGRPVEVEVENLIELQQALDAGADTVMLDNMDLAALREAVALTAGRSRLEASGNVDLGRIRAIAETGVDYISVGAITKDIRAVDLSMRLLKQG